MRDVAGMSVIHEALSTITVGGVGIWTLVGMMRFGWWRGLPKMIPVIIQLITERNAKLAAGFDQQIARLEEQLKANDIRNTAQIDQADRRHAECLRDNGILLSRVTEAQDEIRALKTKLSSFEAQWRQIGASTVAVLPGSMVSQEIQRAAQSVKDIDALADK